MGHSLRRLTRAALGALLASAWLAPAVVQQPAAAAPVTATQVHSGRAAPVPQLRRDGRWLVDEHGRVVIVHGLNLVWKHAPYVPPATAEGFTAADARWMRRHGFNGARLGTLWAGVTPDEP